MLDQGYVQFGPGMYQQALGVFMGTPDIANAVEFIHEIVEAHE